eukprot:gene2050-17240_t
MLALLRRHAAAVGLRCAPAPAGAASDPAAAYHSAGSWVVTDRTKRRAAAAGVHCGADCGRQPSTMCGRAAGCTWVYPPG